MDCKYEAEPQQSLYKINSERNSSLSANKRPNETVFKAIKAQHPG